MEPSDFCLLGRTTDDSFIPNANKIRSSGSVPLATSSSGRLLHVPDNIKYVVFSGGAGRGFAHLGFLNVLESLLQIYGKVMLEHLDGFAGSSFGAMMALACCLELNYDIIKEWFLNVNTEQIVAKIDFVRILTENGLIPNSVLVKKVEELIRLRFGNENYTFKELHQRTRTHLRIAVSNLSLTTVEIWDHVTHPNMRVKICVAASMAIPFIFEPFAINGHLYGDGGFYCTGNYPITAFPATSVLGVRLDGVSTLDGTNPPLSQYAMHMALSPMEFSERMMLSTISEQYKRRTISVHVPSCGVMNLINPSRKLREEFIKRGEEAAMEYFIQNTFLARVAKMFIDYKVIRRLPSQAPQPATTETDGNEAPDSSVVQVEEESSLGSDDGVLDESSATGTV